MFMFLGSIFKLKLHSHSSETFGLFLPNWGFFSENNFGCIKKSGDVKIILFWNSTYPKLNVCDSSSGPSRRFRRVVETIQAQLLSSHDHPLVSALSGKIA